MRHTLGRHGVGISLVNALRLSDVQVNPKAEGQSSSIRPLFPSDANASVQTIVSHQVVGS